MNFVRISNSEITQNKNEVFHYLGIPYDKIRSEDVDASLSLQVDECMNEMRTVLKMQGLWQVFDLVPISCNPDTPDEGLVRFADVELHSADLARNLRGCTKVALLAATIGPQVDSLIRKYEKTDVAKAAVMQAVGAMYIEEFVEFINAQITEWSRSHSFSTRPRFSPGYGDVSLAVQQDFFRLLPCTQRLGLTLMDSLVMAPEKSVTAFVGVL